MGTAHQLNMILKNQATIISMLKKITSPAPPVAYSENDREQLLAYLVSLVNAFRDEPIRVNDGTGST